MHLHIKSGLVPRVTDFRHPESVDHLKIVLESFWETATTGIKEPSDSKYTAEGLFL